LPTNEQVLLDVETELKKLHVIVSEGPHVPEGLHTPSQQMLVPPQEVASATSVNAQSTSCLHPLFSESGKHAPPQHPPGLPSAVQMAIWVFCVT
jgi:hypothetical protein